MKTSRRSFLSKSALALFGFSILPGAGRIWKAQKRGCFVSEYVMGIDPAFNSKDRNFIFVAQLHPMRYKRNPETGLIEMINRLEIIKVEIVRKDGEKEE